MAMQDPLNTEEGNAKTTAGFSTESQERLQLSCVLQAFIQSQTCPKTFTVQIGNT